MLEKTWKSFVKSGAKLDADGKKRLAAINEELSSLGATFGQNVLADEKDWVLFLDEGDLAGLPAFLRSAMAEAAESRGQQGPLRGHAVALDLRALHDLFRAPRPARDRRSAPLPARGENGGETDNAEVVKAMLRLRAEKARLRRLRQLCRAEARRHHGQDAGRGARPARAGLGKGAREGGGRRGGAAAPRRGRRQQRHDRGLGLALLSRRSCAPRNSPSTRPS